MKRKALLAALRVGSMQAVYAMQPESAAFRAQLQCFEPDESFLSEAMSGIWDDAERAVATRRASPEKAVTANLEEAACQAASEEGRGHRCSKWSLCFREAQAAAVANCTPVAGPAARPGDPVLRRVTH